MKATKKTIRRVILSAVIILIIIYRLVFCVPIWQFLDTIHYNIDGYISHLFRHAEVDFSPYKSDFELIVKYVYEFADNRVGFYENFSGKFSLKNNGIKFFLKGYTDSEFYEINDPKWPDAVKNHRKAFYEEFFYGEYRGYSVTKNYICIEGGLNNLVFTKDRGYPDAYIDRWWSIEHYPIVDIIKLARGWYEIHIGY